MVYILPGYVTFEILNWVTSYKQILHRVVSLQPGSGHATTECLMLILMIQSKIQNASSRYQSNEQGGGSAEILWPPVLLKYSRMHRI